jgi:putative transposase
MDQKITLEPAKYYHIFNCGINGEDLFKSKDDYMHWFHLYERYIEPVCETYAWVLMKNHFHLFVKIKENVIYKYSKEEISDEDRFNEVKWETKTFFYADGSATPSGLKYFNLSSSAGHDSVKNKIPQAYKHFSHLFNAYSKYYNIRFNRHGSLFERPFKRKEVNNRRYFRYLIIYIHQNPVHHGFCEHPMDYAWSSYQTLVSVKPTKLNRNKVIGWFDDIGNFKSIHDKMIETRRIEEWLEI